MKKILMICIVMIYPTISEAAIYKWVDKHGQTHYGEKPPAGHQAKKIQLQSQSLPTTSSAVKPQGTEAQTSATKSRLEKQQKLIRALSEDRKQKQEQREKLQRMEKQRIRNCVISKDNLRRYETSSTVYKVDDKGNRITLPGSERAKSIQRARAEVIKWCGK